MVTGTVGGVTSLFFSFTFFDDRINVWTSSHAPTELVISRKLSIPVVKAFVKASNAADKGSKDINTPLEFIVDVAGPEKKSSKKYLPQFL